MCGTFPFGGGYFGDGPAIAITPVILASPSIIRFTNEQLRTPMLTRETLVAPVMTGEAVVGADLVLEDLEP